MATPRVITEFCRDGSVYKVVWVGIGKYEIWMDNKPYLNNMTMDNLIRCMSNMLDNRDEQEQPGANF